MGRHSRRRRSERAAAREEKHARQAALRDEQEHQEALLRWKHRRADLIRMGLLPDEAQRRTRPMPLRPAAARSPLRDDDTPPTTPLNLAAMIPAPRREDQR